MLGLAVVLFLVGISHVLDVVFLGIHEQTKVLWVPEFLDLQKIDLLTKFTPLGNEHEFSQIFVAILLGSKRMPSFWAKAFCRCASLSLCPLVHVQDPEFIRTAFSRSGVHHVPVMACYSWS